MQPQLLISQTKTVGLSLSVSTALCIWDFLLEEVETLGAPRSEIDSASLHFQGTSARYTLLYALL